MQQTHHFHIIHGDSAIFDSRSIDDVVKSAVVRLTIVVSTVKKNAEITLILLSPNQNSF